MSTSISAAHTAVNDYLTCQGIRLINRNKYGSTNLIHASPSKPQNTMYLPDVRPPIDNH